MEHVFSSYSNKIAQKAKILMVLLDTHTLLWLMRGTSELGRVARRAADDAMRQGQLAVSAFVFWELAMIQYKFKEILVSHLEVWRRGVLDFGITELPVSGDIAIAAHDIKEFHKDPADRLIMATALRYDAMLITADRAILTWKGGLKCLDACK